MKSTEIKSTKRKKKTIKNEPVAETPEVSEESKILSMEEVEKLTGLRLLKRIKKPFFVSVISVFIFLLASTFLINTYYNNKLEPFIKNAADVETLDYRYSAIILGAGLDEDTKPSEMLQDRLDVGYQLLRLGKVSKLILSGDNREESHNEPQSMKDYLVNKGIDPNKLVLDPEGLRTYDSCYRAKNIYGQDKAFIISQDFHIVRAVFLCKSVGIDTIGITADLHDYPNIFWNVIRDYIGMVNAFWDIKVSRPTQLQGEKIQI